jgi:hypothetical protein
VPDREPTTPLIKALVTEAHQLAAVLKPATAGVHRIV